MAGKTGRGARKRLLPEREETWELGNGKGQSSPLPTHGFLSPPPPSANTWHGHKLGLCSFSLTRTGLGHGGKGWHRAGWATVALQGQGLAFRVGSWLYLAFRQALDNRTSIRNATTPEESGTASISGEGEASLLDLGVVCWCFVLPPPQLLGAFLLVPPYLPLRFCPSTVLIT